MEKQNSKSFNKFIIILYTIIYLQIYQNKKKVAWDVAVLDLWQEYVEQLRAARKNGHIYKEMAEKLSPLGYIFSGREIQIKLSNFQQRYRYANIIFYR